MDKSGGVPINLNGWKALRLKGLKLESGKLGRATGNTNRAAGGSPVADIYIYIYIYI